MTVLDLQNVKAGSVMVRNLNQVDLHRYSGIRLVAEGQGYYETETQLEIISADEMLETMTPVSGKGLLRQPLAFNFRYKRVRLMDEPRFLRAHGFTDVVPSGLPGSVELLSLSTAKSPATEDYRVLDPGAVATVERSRTIKHVVELSNLESLESLDIDVLYLIRLEIKGSIERRLGRSLELSETYRDSVTLDGTRGRRWRLTWFDQVSTGVARYTNENGEVHKLPFRFTENTALEAVVEE